MAQLTLIAVAVLVAGFVQGATGFGFALLSAPVIGLTEPSLLPVLLLVQMLPINTYIAWRERHDLDRTSVTWVTVGRFVGTFGGLWVLLLVTERQLSILIGAFTVVAVLTSFVVPAFEPRRPALVTAGFVTGVTETSTGIGGPPLAVVFQHLRPATLRSSVAACFLIGELISVAILAVSGQITSRQITISLVMLPPAIIGVLLSRLVHHRLHGSAMRHAVLGLAFISGVVVLVQAV